MTAKIRRQKTNIKLLCHTANLQEVLMLVKSALFSSSLHSDAESHQWQSSSSLNNYGPTISTYNGTLSSEKYFRSEGMVPIWQYTVLFWYHVNQSPKTQTTLEAFVTNTQVKHFHAGCCSITKNQPRNKNAPLGHSWETFLFLIHVHQLD